MKKLILSAATIAILCSLTNSSFAQNKKQVSVTFKNNSILPRKYTFVTYSPTQKGNSTNGFVLAPYATKTIKDEVGTALFLAEQKEVSVVMSGKKIKSEPFLIFNEDLNNKTINLRVN
jgi:hypothetical protein